MEPCLLLLDSRTGKSYTIPIRGNDYISAADVGQITAPDTKIENGDAGVQVSRSLRILDKGFQHTACMESSITLMYDIVFPHLDTWILSLTIFHKSDGQRGAIRYREFPIQDLFHEYVYEDVMHLIIWGALPSLKQKDDVRASMGQAAVPSKSVIDVISAFPFVYPERLRENRSKLLKSLVTGAIRILSP